MNFVAAYIPYLGAWSAGAFTVLIALGSQRTVARARAPAGARPTPEPGPGGLADAPSG